MKITFTKTESEEIFFTALCNGLGYFSGNGLRLEYKDEEYAAAKEQLQELRPSEMITFEEVLMQMLRRGDSLLIEDLECDGEYSRAITMNDVYEKMSLVPTSHLMDMINQQDDATTADVVLQTICFGEVVFG